MCICVCLWAERPAEEKIEMRLLMEFRKSFGTPEDVVVALSEWKLSGQKNLRWVKGMADLRKHH
jgi:hypothetical protein